MKVLVLTLFLSFSSMVSHAEQLELAEHCKSACGCVPCGCAAVRCEQQTKESFSSGENQQSPAVNPAGEADKALGAPSN